MSPITLDAFLNQRSQDSRRASTAGVWLRPISGVVRKIARIVRRAGLAHVLGAVGTYNVHGEAVQKLDGFAHQAFTDLLTDGSPFAAIASEESETIDIAKTPASPSGLLAVDPLDGSSNIDVAVGVGSIFSVRTTEGAATEAGFLKSGRTQQLAGYALYGSSVLLVFTWGEGVYGFTLDPDPNEFFLSHDQIETPLRGCYYSLNEGHGQNWSPGTLGYVEEMKREGRSARYVGSLVADFHRNLLKGGVFLYPADKKNTQGKLRLLYEAAPLAYIAQQARGAATNGETAILDIVPKKIHERTPLIIGSPEDVKRATELHQSMSSLSVERMEELQ